MTQNDLWVTPGGELLVRQGEELYRKSRDIRRLTQESAGWDRLTPAERHEVERWLEAYDAVREVDPHLAVVQIRKRRGAREGVLTVERNFISILTGKRERGEVSKKRVDMEMLAFLQALVHELQADGFTDAEANYAGDAYYNVRVPVPDAAAAANAASIMLEFDRKHAY